VKWAVKGSQAVSIQKEVHVHTYNRICSHLLEDGMDIITLKDLYASKYRDDDGLLQIA
jgi:site-specific recombinase XerD